MTARKAPALTVGPLTVTLGATRTHTPEFACGLKLFPGEVMLALSLGRCRVGLMLAGAL